MPGIKDAITSMAQGIGLMKKAPVEVQKKPTVYQPQGEFAGGQYLNEDSKKWLSQFKDRADYEARATFKDPGYKPAWDRNADYYWAETADTKLYHDTFMDPEYKSALKKMKELKGANAVQRSGRNLGGINEGIAKYVIDEARRGGVDEWDALALALRESSFGNAKVRQNEDGSVGAANLYSYWAGLNDPVAAGEQLFNKSKKAAQYYEANGSFKDDKQREDYKAFYDAYKNDAAQMKAYTGKNMTADAVRYFQAGKYNPGDPDYISKVRKDADWLKNNKAFMEWYNSYKK